MGTGRSGTGRSGTGRSLVAAALTLALLGVAGCSDDDADGDTGSTPSPTSSTASSPSQSATTDEPTQPEWPAAADGTGDKAARAFARYWLEMVNYAQATGDTAPLKALHASYCSACKSGVAQVEKGWAKGKSLIGGEYQIIRMATVPSPEKIVHIIELRTNYSKQTRLDAAGNVLRTTGRGPAAFRLYLRMDGGSWVVGALEVKQ